MRRHWIFGLAVSLAAVSAQAADTELRALMRDDESRQWAAVGRVNLGDTGFCTGAMIRPDLVLTAAHCFFDRRTGERFLDSQVRFVAGYKEGAAQAVRGARAVHIADGYEFSNGVTHEAIGYDMALIVLDQPIVSDRMRPFATASRPQPGDQVAVVSYAQGRESIPSIQEVCTVMAEEREVLALTCNVTFGASGSPIFVMGDSGPQVVSVVSASAFMNGAPVSLSVVLDDRFDALMARAAGSVAGARKRQAGKRSLSEQLGRPTGGGVVFGRPGTSE